MHWMMMMMMMMMHRVLVCEV